MAPREKKKTSCNPKKVELAEFNSEMSREQITRNLIQTLKNSGFKIVDEKSVSNKSEKDGGR